VPTSPKVVRILARREDSSYIAGAEVRYDGLVLHRFETRALLQLERNY